MENWKKWLIISGIVSVICGVGAIIIYVGSLVNCEPIWYNPLGEKMGGYCSINTQNLELWWVIPLAFLIGFIIPYITWIIAKIRARIYIPILDD